MEPKQQNPHMTSFPSAMETVGGSTTMESFAWWTDAAEQKLFDSLSKDAQHAVRALNVKPSAYLAAAKAEGQAPESGSAMSLGDIIKRIAGA